MLNLPASAAFERLHTQAEILRKPDRHAGAAPLLYRADREHHMGGQISATDDEPCRRAAGARKLKCSASGWLATTLDGKVTPS